MRLAETQALQSPRAAFKPGWAVFGCVKQPKWFPLTVEYKLAILGLRKSE